MYNRLTVFITAGYSIWIQETPCTSYTKLPKITDAQQHLNGCLIFILVGSTIYRSFSTNVHDTDFQCSNTYFKDIANCIDKMHAPSYNNYILGVQLLVSKHIGFKRILHVCYRKTRFNH